MKDRVMAWLKNRMAEPSTRLALGLLVAFLTQILNHPPVTPGDWVTILSVVLGGIAGVATAAPGAPDSPATIARA